MIDLAYLSRVFLSTTILLISNVTNSFCMQKLFFFSRILLIERMVNIEHTGKAIHVGKLSWENES